MPVVFSFSPLLKSPHSSSSHSSTPISSSLNPRPLQNPSANSRPRPVDSVSIAANHVNVECSAASESSSVPIAAVRMCTAPWMTGPLVLEPHEDLDPAKPRNQKRSKNGNTDESYEDLTGKTIGIRGKQAMRKIVRSIERLQKMESSEEVQMARDRVEFGDCLEGLVGDVDSEMREKMPWEREERIIFTRLKKQRSPSAAELRLDRALLERLRNEAAKMRQWLKVKKAGVTRDCVSQIHFIWKRNELAMLKFDVPLSRNMGRAQEIVEIKTGGLVIWNKKDIIVVYRGCNYLSNGTTHPYKRQSYPYIRPKPSSANYPLKMEHNVSAIKSNDTFASGKMNEKSHNGVLITSDVLLTDDVNFQTIGGSLYKRETDRLLDGLGPRFVDWWMHKPLPVDADLLPEVPGFSRPFRRCPPQTRPKLTNDELTYLRKLTHSLPTHFVLGRNRNLQGLAAAILKLWEKSLIVKIAVKWGIPNVSSEQMAYELKCLTGGVLLLRNKFFIILYRGKDFVPGQVNDLIVERELELQKCLIQEDIARLRARETICVDDRPLERKSAAGTLSDFRGIQREYGSLNSDNGESNPQLEAAKERLKGELRKQERKLSILNYKIQKSEKDLSRLNALWEPAAPDTDQEIITEEERECLRKIGLKMDGFLVLGRRGVFDGVIEGLHQHWKHREVVKVVTMQRALWQVINTATLLETQSGGVLVAVEKLKEGHAIILYRGKNYRRPLKRPRRNLLSKRQALQRSLEMQRIGSLKFFARQRQQSILELKRKLEGDAAV